MAKEHNFGMDSGRKFKKHLINSNPKDLIREIKCRPGLYDKEQLEQPKREHKQQLWKEVAESLTPSDVWESYDENEKHMKSKFPKKHIKL